MEVRNVQDFEDIKIDRISFKGQARPVTGTSVRWFSKCGDDGSGGPEYGLRYFTIQPGGVIPIHSHFYIQTMYFLTGRYECYSYDEQTEAVLETRVTGPGDSVFVPSMEPHGMKNIGDEPGTFLCCIANVYDRKQG